MLIFVPSSIYINLTTKIMIKKKDKKSKYPDYIEVSAIDKVISEGKDPIEMMQEMKRAILERALNAELDHHLGYNKNGNSNDGNYRNGSIEKRLLTDNEELNVSTPRDRLGTFEPQLIPKRARHLKGFDDQIISMYGRGMSMREIQGHLEEIYGMEVSPELISNVTDAVMEEVVMWQNRPLDSIYPILYLDAMVVKVRENKQIINKSLYFAMGVNMDGNKEILGMWLSKTEGAKFWLGILNELKNRGVQDVLICCVDGLSGFSEAINAVFPQTIVQRCIVHLIRNSLNFVPWKDKKAIVADLKSIYGANTEADAESALSAFEEKWDDKYPTISDIWRRNWSEIVPFLQYPKDIRKAIYTTNVIEASNRQVRKIIKTKGSFSSDEAVYKIVYLALTRASKKWTMPIRDWKQALCQFSVLFADRLILS